MKKSICLLIALFLGSCTTDELTPDSRPDDNDAPTTKSLYSVSITGINNHLSVSCTGTSVFLREVSITGLSPAFSYSKDFQSNQRSVTVGVPGYGTYSIQVSYVDTRANVQEQWDAVFYYQSERAEENRTETNVPAECQHDFSGITGEKWWSRDGSSITFYITVIYGNYQAVLYPTYTPDKHPEKYIQTCLLNRETSMYPLLFSDAPVGYELRIYSADCQKSYETCTHYSSYPLTKTSTTGREPLY